MGASAYTEDTVHVQGSTQHSGTEQRWSSRPGKGLVSVVGGLGPWDPKGHIFYGGYCAPCSMRVGLSLQQKPLREGAKGQGVMGPAGADLKGATEPAGHLGSRG